MAEVSRKWSPYNYGMNNPVGMIDPDGMLATYNWYTGTYQDGGNDVSWDEVQQQYGIGQYSNTGQSGKTDDGGKQKKDDRVRMTHEQILQAGWKDYGGDYSGDWYDDLLGAADAINQINPVAMLWDAVHGAMYGTDRFGNPMSSVETGSNVLFAIIPIGGEFRAAESEVIKILSSVKTDKSVLRLARQTFEGNQALRDEANSLLKQVSKGNRNPGAGTRFIGNGIYELRGKTAGARIYFRNVEKNVIDIVGYSHKGNQQQVIDYLMNKFK